MSIWIPDPDIPGWIVERKRRPNFNSLYKEINKHMEQTREEIERLDSLWNNTEQ